MRFCDRAVWRKLYSKLQAPAVNFGVARGVVVPHINSRLAPRVVEGMAEIPAAGQAPIDLGPICCPFKPQG
jgi:hypothetical protein